MPTFYDSNNEPYVLGEQLGRGGEGAVFACENPGIVAKIYHEPIEAEKAEKLRWMAQNKDEHLLKVAAWVIDVLRDAPDGKVVGFLMPSVRAKEIHELYSLKSRRVYFPEATWQFLLHSAANVSRAFFSLHRNNHVMGDVNHGNCVVLADGTVKLIDCDSYSISRGEFRYRCEVGVATHLAPELQGVDLGEVERKANHDNFGLAVIIFQLLFLGRHPFSGNYLGDEDKSLEDCIREKRFAYGDNTQITNVKQPPGTLSLSEVSPRIAAMLERAFMTEDRPEPREWVEALEDLSRSLEQCSLHPGHHYYNKLAACPWCRIEAQTGLMLFPFVTSANDLNGEKSFNIFTIENLIANLGINRNLPAKPPLAEILPSPSPGLLEKRKGSRNFQIGIVAVQFVLITFFMIALGIGAGVFIGIISMIILIVSLNNKDKSLRAELNERLFEVREEWDKIEYNWGKALVPQNVDNDLTQIRKKIDNYQKLQQTGIQKVNLVNENLVREKFGEFLRSFDISEAENFGVIEAERRMLIKKGIKTAAEIDEKRLIDFYNIEGDLTEKLVKWRRAVESRFEFEGEITEEEKHRITQEVAGKRRIIEREIEQIFASLRLASVNLRHHQKQLVEKSASVGNQILQTESDLLALGNSSAAIVVLILVTFMTPFWGGIISGFPSSVRGYVLPNNPPPNGIKTKTVPPMPAKPAVYNMLDENITDEEIAEISPANKGIHIDALLNEADTAIQQKDYYSAEKKLRLALRLNPNQIQVLNKLGYALYLQNEHTKSLDTLDKSLKIDKYNRETKNYIGINYLRLKKYKEARSIFTELTANNNATLEGFFNLGLAHEGLKDYKSAVKAFRGAVKIDNADADSLYELGFCLNKIGDKAGAYEQYEKLTEINSALAKRLYENAALEKYEDTMPRPSVSINESSSTGLGTGEGSGVGSGRGSGIGSGSGSGTN